MHNVYLTLAGLFCLVTAASAQISFNGNYIQNFNTLTASTPLTLSDTNNAQTNIGIENWVGTKTGGTSTDFALQPWAASNANVAGFYSFGVDSADADRSIGSVSYATNYGNIVFGTSFTNATGATINAITITYTAEFWRTTASTTQVLTFAYGLSGGSLNGSNFLTASMTTSAGLSVTSPSSVSNTVQNGNLSANQQSVSLTLTDLNWTTDKTLFIRWTDSDQSGHESAIGVDDLVVSVVPEPSAYAVLAGAAGLVLAVVARRRRS
ncbi:PEP-CTERM sorting domain-containing protein [Rariglobus hedericola]|nr:PEP-CTERM sorting domain-containing protein [Rariglobus hedericola]